MHDETASLVEGKNRINTASSSKFLRFKIEITHSVGLLVLLACISSMCLVNCWCSSVIWQWCFLLQPPGLLFSWKSVFTKCATEYLFFIKTYLGCSYFQSVFLLTSSSFSTFLKMLLLHFDVAYFSSHFFHLLSRTIHLFGFQFSLSLNSFVFFFLFCNY